MSETTEKVPVETTVTRMEKGRAVVTTDFKGYPIVKNVMMAVVCFLFTVTLIGAMGTALNYYRAREGILGNTGYSGVIFNTTQTVTIVFYVAILFTFLAVLALVMFRQKSPIPLPPLEDLCVDMLLLTVAGLTLSYIAVLKEMQVFVVVLAGFILLYLPLSRFYRHVFWWLVDVPQMQKREEELAAKEARAESKGVA